ncbi:MAG: hypothetical protein ABIU05_01215 [Nitrospirales bacterium]
MLGESPPGFFFIQALPGTVAAMSMRIITAMSILVVGTGLALFTSCSQLQTPRFTYPTEPRPVIPLSVKLVFDESVRSAMLEQTVCADVVWKGRLGDAIIQSFSETGRVRLAQLTVGDQSGTTQPATTPASEFTAFITLASASFTPTSRSGSDDNNYLAQFDVRLKATFQDAQGRRFPDAPMVYSNRVALWTPPITGSDNQCATGQLDAAVQTAADHLANQLMGFLTQLQEKTQGESTAGRKGLDGRPSLLALKVTLLDENSNRVLESGEKFGVRIDVTNTGKATLGAAAITLSGTPALIDAFAGTLSPLVRMVNLQPGETKSTILWGTLPANAEGSHGELTVTVTPSRTANGAPATQTLIAVMSSRGMLPASAPSPAMRQASTPAAGGQIPDRYAVIVGLGQYRTPWMGWRDGLSFDTKETLSRFAESLQVPEGHTLLLQDELATQANVEEALALWLTKRVTKDSIVFFYFAGHARANSTTGEIFLIPYDTTPQSSLIRLISLRVLQKRLLNLGARLVVAIIDAPVAMDAAAKNSTIRHAAPNWIGDLDRSAKVGTGTIIQVSSRRPLSQTHQSLLSGLTGKADLDKDGTVTVGEWLRSLLSIAVTAPTLPPDLSIQSIPLSRVTPP